MREITNTAPDSESDVNLTPMLDVVFIMLIFFIVTASFVKETGIDVGAPDDPTKKPTDSASILIVIDDSSDIWIGERQIDFRAVRANIERMRSELPGASVVIQASRKSKTKTLVRVMDASRLAGIYDIGLAKVVEAT